MVGGLIQIAAVGKQDTYLTGNPQMTFFKSIYNFRATSIRQSNGRGSKIYQ